MKLDVRMTLAGSTAHLWLLLTSLRFVNTCRSGSPEDIYLDTTDEVKTLSSPNWPHDYPSSRVCYWRVKTGEGHKIGWRFHTDFELEDSSDCDNDYVALYDSSETYDAHLIGKYCGDFMPSIGITQSNFLFIKFSADSSIGYEGFRIAVKRDDVPDTVPGWSLGTVPQMLLWFGVVGLVLTMIFCCLCCWCCYRKRAQRKRDQQRAARRRQYDREQAAHGASQTVPLAQRASYPEHQGQPGGAPPRAAGSTSQYNPYSVASPAYPGLVVINTNAPYSRPNAPTTNTPYPLPTAPNPNAPYLASRNPYYPDTAPSQSHDISPYGPSRGPPSRAGPSAPFQSQDGAPFPQTPVGADEAPPSYDEVVSWSS